MMIDGKSLVHNHLDRFHADHGVDDRRKSRGHSADYVSVGENHVAQLRSVGAIFDASRLNDVANLHI